MNVSDLIMVRHRDVSCNFGFQCLYRCSDEGCEMGMGRRGESED